MGFSSFLFFFFCWGCCGGGWGSDVVGVVVGVAVRGLYKNELLSFCGELIILSREVGLVGGEVINS